MIKFSNITRYYNQKKAVDDLSFEIHPNRITGLLGPNGSGKTTLLRLLLRIIPPDSGVITLNNAEFDEKIYNLTGYLPEERGFYKREKVINIFKFIARIKNHDIKKSLPNFLNLLERFSLLDIQNRKGDELSKGQAQIVQIAIALSMNPQILVLDEPYSGLDTHNQQIFDDLIREFKSEGKYIILSTHLIEQASTMVDDMILLSSGKLLYSGSIENFVGGAAEEYTVELKNNELTIPLIKDVKISDIGSAKYQLSFSDKSKSELILKELFANNSVLSITKVNSSITSKYLAMTNSVWD